MDEVNRVLFVIGHVVMTLMSIPYVLLAAFFLMVGRVASQRGLWAILDTFLTTFNWAMTWGIAGMGLTLITIIALGFFDPLRWWATLALGGLMCVSLCIIAFYWASYPTLDELFFLAPALLIVTICCWRLLTISVAR